MKKIVIILILFSSYLSVSAQYTKVINSKRPGFSESPYGVGTKVFQLETGAFYRKNDLKSTFYTDNSLGANLFLRYGAFSEKLEFNLGFAFQSDKRSFHNIFNTNKQTVTGISELTLGAKFLVYNQKYADRSKEIRSWKKRHAFDFKRLIPSVGVYVGWNSNFLSSGFKENGMSFKGVILLQNDISSRFVIISNLIVDKIAQDLEYGYMVTATYALNEKWSIFGEHQGVFKKVANNEFQYGVGAAYLVNNNLQVDLAARTSLIGGGFSNYASLGGSWRLDGHAKKRKAGTELKGTKEPFFKRIFKKRKRKPKVRKIKKHKRRKSRRAKRGTPSFFKKKKKGRKRHRRERRRKRKSKEE